LEVPNDGGNRIRRGQRRLPMGPQFQATREKHHDGSALLEHRIVWPDSKTGLFPTRTVYSSLKKQREKPGDRSHKPC